MAAANPLLVIAGPTASGKSALSLSCARHLHAEILSVDSVQIYRGLDIGSAKLTLAQREGVPHHLLDIREPDAAFNVADFLREAEASISDIQGRGKSCVVCAGTTLYLTALLHGLVESPSQDLVYRASLEGRPSEDLHEALARLDPVSAQKLHPRDRVRLVRALEVAHLTGKAPSLLQSEHAYRTTKHAALILVLCWNRKDLYARINQRSQLMLEQGLVEETRALCQRFPEAKQALRTLGYAQAMDFLAGKLPEERLCEEIAMQTRRYAKRQMTYWRNEPAKRGWQQRPTPEEAAMEIDALSPAPRGKSLKCMRVLSLSVPDLLVAAERRISTLQEEIELWYVDAAALLAA
ncbi:MAG: tRNA (adenosine(37)-N6)-dimethylallyltransferase MiaA [Deltaproteobacteria bacterium]|nr:tRNA (adenosine(37)-N6)-dimethylallyltransferase MiaA [Deltaproteobacteria bacterium]